MENTNNTKEQTGGLKLMTVFIFVLAAHVVVIGGYTAYRFVKGPAKDSTAEVAQAAAAPEAAAPDAAPTGENKAPAIDTMAKDGSATPAPAPEVDPNAVTQTPEAGNATTANSGAAPAPSPTMVQNPVPAKAPAPAAAKAPAQAVAPAPVPAGGSQAYVVKSGDTLHKIAAAHGMTVAALKGMNGLKSDMLKIGQKLTVGGSVIAQAPAAPEMTATAAPVPATPAAPAAATTTAAGSKTYTVAKGDTLVHIAKQFNTSAAALMAANKLSDPKKLKIGQVLVIPGKADRQQVTQQQAVPSAMPNQPKTNPDLVLNK